MKKLKKTKGQDLKLTKAQKEFLNRHHIDTKLMMSEIADGLTDIDDLIDDVEECYENTRGKYVFSGVVEDLVELSYILERVIKPQIKNVKSHRCSSCGVKS